MKKIAAAVIALMAALLIRQFLAQPDVPLPEPVDRIRIVSLAPNLTGILFDLGEGDAVVGVTQYCDYPPEAADREKIGDFINPNFEKIVSLQPDLIVTEKWTSSKTASRLRQLGLRVSELPTPKSMSEIFSLINEVGELLGRQEKAASLVAKMRQRVAAVQAKSDGFPYPPRVYLEIDLPTWTVGADSFTSEAIEICGGVNIFGNLPVPSAQVSSESVIERDPQIIVTFVANAEHVKSRPGWAKIDAVRHGRVIDDFNESLLSQGSQRLVTGIEELQERIRKVMGF